MSALVLLENLLAIQLIKTNLSHCLEQRSISLSHPRKCEGKIDGNIYANSFIASHFHSFRPPGWDRTSMYRLRFLHCIRVSRYGRLCASEPKKGIEPLTSCLQDRCSTAELLGHGASVTGAEAAHTLPLRKIKLLLPALAVLRRQNVVHLEICNMSVFAMILLRSVLIVLNSNVLN